MAMLNNQMVVWYKHVSAIWIHELESLNIGGLNPEKYEFASWDHEIPNWMGSHNPFMFQTTNQNIIIIIPLITISSPYVYIWSYNNI